MRKTSLPHSWSIDCWPPEVFPGSASKARYLVRANRDSLLRGGVIARVGRTLIIFGSRFSAWLEKRAADVPGYDPVVNRRRRELREHATADAMPEELRHLVAREPHVK